MNRPRLVVVILFYAVLSSAFFIVGFVITQRLVREDVMDPAHLAYATSIIHLSLVALECALGLSAAILLYFLRASALFLFSGVLGAQVFDLIYFWVTANSINLDLTIFVNLFILSYSYILLRRGFLS